ncbi:MDR family MFS transporter [Acidisoma cladoniae]|jgi:EmrB/QacA subfamily drug resistance transporter|uniref:MDR family MFS transporter n=1 Tax=Acidisoma cladoniae TaxID=3040935 RepID=UPI00254FDC80|nr:MDR family MFS transporter [Acidisoma sp. PAMC 29798]
MNDVFEEEIPLFTHAQIMRVLAGILLCILLAAIDQTVVIPAVPAIAADLHGFGHLSWILTAYLLPATVATPIYGKMSDIYGRRALLLPALVIFVIASGLCAAAQTLTQLIVFRALQGLGGAGLMSMAQAAVADVISPRERGRYQGYMASTWGVASVAGPILGGWVTDQFSWRWIFWANIPIGLLAILLCHQALKTLKVQRQSVSIDWIGASLLTGGVTCWLLVLSWGGVSMPWTASPILSLTAVGAAFIAVLFLQERRATDPLLPPRLFGHSVFLRGVIVAFMSSLVLFGVTFLLPLFFQLVLGASASRSGLLVVPLLGSSCLGAYLSGQVARRLGKTKTVLIVGLFGCMLGFLMLATLQAKTPLAFSMIYTTILGIGLGATLPSSLVIVQNAAQRRDVGVATGSLLFLRSLGGAFGSTLVGTLLASRFNRGLADAGVGGRVSLSDLREHADALRVLGGSARHIIRAGLLGGFHLSFLACAFAMALAIAVAWGMNDLPLRSATTPAPIAH